MLAQIGSALAIALMCATEPGDDFFAYANSEWLEATEIPSGSGRWNARNEISDLTRRQVTQLIEDAAAASAGTEARKVADFRAAYQNDARDVAALLRAMFERIDGVHDKTALMRLLGSGLRADVDPLNRGVYDSAHLLGLSVQAGNHGEHDYVAFLLQGGLGLSTRQQYLDPSAAAQALRTKYRERIAQELQLAGFDGAARRAEAVLALEIAIARSHATPEDSSNESNAGNLWSRAEFARRAPGVDWTAFFAAAGLATQPAFVVWQPSAVEGAAKLIATRPLASWQDYLRFRAIDLHAEVLPRGLADSAAQAVPRAQRAAEATERHMSGALGRMYAERHFAAGKKARVQGIVENVIAAFRRRIDRVVWLSPASKKQALAKLESLYFGVGYPQKWSDYSTLAVNPDDPLGNLQRIAAWNYQNALARIGQHADRTDWAMAPQVAGAVLLFHQNAYNFSAALLQAPKFDAEASDAANYGAIGAIVGHEICHFVDTLGADYDAAGRKVRWWTATDLAQYRAATEPLIRQFSQYRPFPDLAIDGKLTLVENVADLAGLAAAFDAYRATLGTLDTEDVRQQDRQFFIGFARAWRAKYRDDALRAQVANDHAPENYRVATVRNLDAWYEAFGVHPRHRLYLEPAARVRVW